MHCRKWNRQSKNSIEYQNGIGTKKKTLCKKENNIQRIQSSGSGLPEGEINEKYIAMGSCPKLGRYFCESFEI